MSADPFAMYDGPYVLGALSPQERAAFEEHLRGCETCARAVGELAGLPGLLGQAAPGDGKLTRNAEPPPAALLPALLARVARERRRRRVLTVLSAAAVALAACLALVFTLTSALGNSGSQDGSGTGERPGIAMTPLGDWPVSAIVEIGPVATGGGTRVAMECTYGGDRAGDYVLVAIGRDGTMEELARWHALPRDTARLAVSTPLPRADLLSLEIRTPGGLPVLRSSL
ncbi:anti-sigma factor family protein [Streptomyces sp. NBC_01803]|uniref:anti-sigma factor family protein n=1 Tax=Streptomyces sp. NBC_01803 TaxID=2975946 RepID=UPI002DDC8EA8|nr:zf-HC2 domain-containing protein [Streptomyces sp. NBC_01803]WSA45406.1 zf-HC2 domain-containing protein [Streptomyces sp. NBC_01803]